MTPETTIDTDTDDATTELCRNDPTSTFDAHLFEAPDVQYVGGDMDGSKARAPVASVCSRTTSYGPFSDVSENEVRQGVLDGHDGELCGTCADIAGSRYDDRRGEVDLAVDPSRFTVEELETWLDDPDEGGLLDDAELRALAQAERDGKNRTTALDAVEAALDEVDA